MSEHFLRPTHSLGIPVSNAIPSTIEQDEAQLVVASKQGDQDAFAQLVQQHQRRAKLHRRLFWLPGKDYLLFGEMPAFLPGYIVSHTTAR